MKRLLMGLFILICGGFLLPSFFPVRAAQCSGSFGSCKDYACSDGGLCPSSAVCSGANSGMDCCYNYGPYCFSTSIYPCGCSEDTCSGGVPASCCTAAQTTTCKCGCSSSVTGGTCKTAPTSTYPCGCDTNGTPKTCCAQSVCPDGCIDLNNSGGVCGAACYFDESCHSDANCDSSVIGPYAKVKKYYGCPPGPPVDCSDSNDCIYAPGSTLTISAPNPDLVYKSCVYKTDVCTVGVCHPYTCVESANPACVNTGGIRSWDGCDYSCAFCPPSASPSPSPGTCTAATGLGYTRDGTTGVVDALSWTRGTGGTNQYLYVDDTRADVEAGCPGGGGCSGSGCCAIKNTDLGTGATGYSDLFILEAGRLYYWRVVTYSASCQAASATALFVDSCSLSPTSIILRLDDPATPLISQMYSSTDILRTDFSQTGATVNLSPTSDSAYTYETSVAPLAVGAGTITGTAVLTGGVNDCSDTISVSERNLQTLV
jgi:hypothetical protein